MKPTVIGNTNGAAASNSGGNVNSAGISIPINRAYTAAGHGSPQQHHQQSHNQPYIDGAATSYGSPRQQQQPQPQEPQHFQSAFGFDNDMDMDMDNMFPRSRLGRLHHDPFFGGSHFGFPQFSTLGRRARAAGGGNNHMEHENDFFNRLPSEFRQYIPDGFVGRRPASNTPQPQQSQPQHHQHHQAQQLDPRYSPQPQQVDPRYIPQSQQLDPRYAPQTHQQPYYQNQQEYSGQSHHVPQSPSKRLCDAAIQTEEPEGRSEVDCAPSVIRSDNLNQHGLRNTMDMGVKSAAEQEQGPRSHSAPPPEQQQQNLQYQQQQHNPQHFATQTSPTVQGNYSGGPYQQHPPQVSRAYYAPQQQAHPQQKQQTPPPPQTPNGTYVRTIPIFVEGRTEPIINAHKEIPNQYAAPGASASAQASAESCAHPPHQAQASHPQQPRPKPLNTQQQDHGQCDGPNAGVPPQTPHTLDSINKIQNIQRDVLELMGQVEQFKGKRSDKEYVYLDEMLTRNLLKLDTIDTNGKESIRLARKEAIKCIQASINVLEAKAEENARAAAGIVALAVSEQAEATATDPVEENAPTTPQPVDATKIQEPIPLPPPPGAAAESEPKTGNSLLVGTEAAAELVTDKSQSATCIGSSK